MVDRNCAFGQFRKEQEQVNVMKKIWPVNMKRRMEELEELLRQVKEDAEKEKARADRLQKEFEVLKNGMEKERETREKEASLREIVDEWLNGKEGADD